MPLKMVVGDARRGKITSYLKKQIELVYKTEKEKEIIVIDRKREYVNWSKGFDSQIIEADITRKPNIFVFKPVSMNQEKYEKEFSEHIEDLCEFIYGLICKHIPLDRGLKKLENEKKETIKESLLNIYKDIGESGSLTFEVLLDAIAIRDKELYKMIEEKSIKIKFESILEEIFLYGHPYELPKLNKRLNVITVCDKKPNFYSSSISRFHLMQHLKREIRRKIERNKNLVIVLADLGDLSLDGLLLNDILKENLNQIDVHITCSDLERFENSNKELNEKIMRYCLLDFRSINGSRFQKQIKLEPEDFEKGVISVRNKTRDFRFLQLKNTGRRTKKILRIAQWKSKMYLLKLKYPEMGYYERMCRVAGYSEQDINDMVNEAINTLDYDKDDPSIREEICQDEVSYWE
ncbi:hypothetical protein AAGG74_16380 [Bacillus mexicanus]|uniref:hypothetical protein n=1 Tax=Bacillus mexicanus TaxID=2834415 RepID=UPI003D24E3EB